MTNANARLTAIKITDECDTCELCGRSNLKRTVLLSDGRYLGTDCAGQALFGKKSAANSTKVEKQANSATVEREALRIAQAVNNLPRPAVLEGFVRGERAAFVCGDGFALTQFVRPGNAAGMAERRRYAVESWIDNRLRELAPGYGGLAPEIRRAALPLVKR